MRDKKRNGGERGARWRKVNGVGKQDADDGSTRGQEGKENTKEGLKSD